MDRNASFCTRANSSRSAALSQPASDSMQRRELLRVVRVLLDQPTAPFHEDAVRDAIVAELEKCAHVKIEHDAYGNMIARYRRNHVSVRRSEEHTAEPHS